MTMVPVNLKFRGEIPESHRHSLDTRIQWLWHQRFGTVQQVWLTSQQNGDLLDHTAATLFIQAIIGGGDLEAIAQILKRLEGVALDDETLQDREHGQTIKM